MVNCQVIGQQGLSVCRLLKGTVAITEDAWLVNWYTKQRRHLSYLSSYKTVSACIHIVGTHAPAAYSGVAANTTTIPRTMGHQAHSSCPP